MFKGDLCMITKFRLLNLAWIMLLSCSLVSVVTHVAQATSNEQCLNQSTIGSDMATQTKIIGALSPKDALKYMQETPDLLIVDVAATRWFNENHFQGAINVPIEEMNSEQEREAYLNLPTGRPILIYCRLGMIAPGAYTVVLQLRHDFPEISYISGAPLFDEYNAWLDTQS